MGETLAERVQKDRRARKMTWPRYAAFLEMPVSTIYKIARGRITKPHDLTLDQINGKLALPITNPVE